jgi:DNA-binding CsgD family transcriptional regulator
VAALDTRSPEIERHLEIGQQAHEHHLSLGRSVEVLASVHDQIALGALVVNRDGILLRANAVARRWLSGDDGLVLVNEHVQAADGADNALLLKAIASASAEDGEKRSLRESFVLVTRKRGRPLCVVALQADGATLSFFENRNIVVLLLFDLDLGVGARIDVLRELFGFTAREAEFAARMMEGHSVYEVARALNVSMSTARTFLAHVAAKTDSHTQAELVGRLLAIPPVA